MNALVEVETAQATATAKTPVALVICHAPFVLALSSQGVSTSTLRLISQGSHSISAVAPDARNFSRGLAAVA